MIGEFILKIQKKRRLHQGGKRFSVNIESKSINGILFDFPNLDSDLVCERSGGTLFLEPVFLVELDV